VTIDPVGGAGRRLPAQSPRQAGPAGFARELGRRLDGVSFSNHATQRLERRGIALDQSTLARLGDGVSRAAAKGSRDSLVLVDDTAFVVSVRSRTVVTAVDREHMKDHVFTNIDSAVLA
jgi:flagellar operon protein